MDKGGDKYVYFLALGSNLNFPFKNLRIAEHLIELKIGKVIRSSSPYINEAFGYKSQHWFVNRNLMVYSDLSPKNVLLYIKEIEKEIGRVYSKTGYEDRCIDIDILKYDGENILEENLQIPHKALNQRNFFIVPLNEINNENLTTVKDNLRIIKWMD